MISLRGYIFSRPFFEERVPQHVQNIIIRDYCFRNNYNYLLSATAYSMTSSCLMLKNILNDLDEIDGIVAYSIFQLPKKTTIRHSIIKDIISKNKQFHFACENMKIQNKNDYENIETIWQIKITTTNSKF